MRSLRLTPYALRLTPEAKGDIAAIGRYSRRIWGADRGRLYASELAIRIMRLRTRPSLGRSRNDLEPPIRALRSGRHIVFYEVHPDTVLVVRVLHERMDVEAALITRSGSDA